MAFDLENHQAIIGSIREPLYILYSPSENRFGFSHSSPSESLGSHQELKGILPPIYPEWLGGPSFTQAHGIRFAYVGGAMAQGIASSELVVALAKMGALGFFGSAGLSPSKIESALKEIKDQLDPLHLPYGMNLIHTPEDTQMEEHLVSIYLKNGVQKVSASAFMQLSKSIVWYACKGLYKDPAGQIRRSHHVFAKISHPQVAEAFMKPAPSEMLEQLLREGKISRHEAELAQRPTHRPRYHRGVGFGGAYGQPSLRSFIFKD